MFTTQEIDRADHDKWVRETVAGTANRTGLIYEVDGCALGFVSFTFSDQRPEQLVWGIYVGEETAPPGTGTSLGLNALDYAFDILEAQEVISEALERNTRAIALYGRLGFRLVRKRQIQRHPDRTYETVMVFSKSSQDSTTANDG